MVALCICIFVIAYSILKEALQRKGFMQKGGGVSKIIAGSAFSQMHAKILTVSYVTSHCQGGSVKKRDRNFSDATFEDLSRTEFVLCSLF